MNQKEFNKLCDGLEEANKKMVAHMEKTGPRCHMQLMDYDSDEGEHWWECSICGHRKTA